VKLNVDQNNIKFNQNKETLKRAIVYTGLDSQVNHVVKIQDKSQFDNVYAEVFRSTLSCQDGNDYTEVSKATLICQDGI